MMLSRENKLLYGASLIQCSHPFQELWVLYSVMFDNHREQTGFLRTPSLGMRVRVQSGFHGTAEGMLVSQNYIWERHQMKGKDLTCVGAYDRRYIWVKHKYADLPPPTPSKPQLQSLTWSFSKSSPSPPLILIIHHSSTAGMSSPSRPISPEPPLKKERERKFLTCH